VNLSSVYLLADIGQKDTIDANGKIRYGVNAAIEWDDPDVFQKINALR
jgi:hypothetical protein